MVLVGLVAHVMPSIFLVESLGVNDKFAIHIFFITAVLRKLFDIRFSYKHCNFSRVCLLFEMATKSCSLRKQPTFRDATKIAAIILVIQSSTYFPMNSYMLFVCPKPGITSVQNSSNKARNCDSEVQNKTESKLA